MQPISVLMTGAGAPGAAGIIHCLKQSPGLQLLVGDADAEAVGRFLHPHFVQLPPASGEGFIEAVLQICRANGVQVVLPLVTRELMAFSLHRERFLKQGIRVLVSSPEAMAIANNKSACYRFLQQKGIAVPRYYVADTLDEFIAAANNLHYLQNPICFKPSFSNGSRGFRVIGSVDEWELLFHHKPYHTHITYEEAVRILGQKPFPQLLVSAWLPGDEYSVDCLADEGTPKLVVPRLRKKMINGISVKGTITEEKDVMDYCTEIIRAARLHGNIGIQVKRAADGRPLLLEINPRVQGTIVANLGAGVNLPLLAVKQAMGLPLTEREMAVRWGVQFSRYWSEVWY